MPTKRQLRAIKTIGKRKRQKERFPSLLLKVIDTSDIILQILDARFFNEMRNKTIEEYIQTLRQDALPVEQIVLFGSYAKGTQHKWSDIDLCIISPKFRNSWKATQYLWSKRLHDNGLTIEPVGFTKQDFQQPSSLIEEIKKTGIKIPVNFRNITRAS